MPGIADTAGRFWASQRGEGPPSAGDTISSRVFVSNLRCKTLNIPLADGQTGIFPVGAYLWGSCPDRWAVEIRFSPWYDVGFGFDYTWSFALAPKRYPQSPFRS